MAKAKLYSKSHYSKKDKTFRMIRAWAAELVKRGADIDDIRGEARQLKTEFLVASDMAALAAKAGK